MEDDLSLLDFIRVLKMIKISKNFYRCLKKLNINLSTFLGILEFLQNVNIIKLTKNKRIKIENDVLLRGLFIPPSKLSLRFLKVFPRIATSFLSHKKSLLRFFSPKFDLSKSNYQFPCSIKTSILRAKTIINNINFNSQKALFIGDDDMVSLLCKCMFPDLSITVIEIDGRITKLLKENAIEKKFGDYKVYNLDIKEISEVPEIVSQKYSIIHLDPPYESTQLTKFFNALHNLIDKKITQIFLNGIYEGNSIKILNSFLVENGLKVNQRFKSYNIYPCNSTNIKYLESLRKEIKQYYNLRFTIKELKKIQITSDLFIIENLI